jgi:thiamine transport system substrate-binding protein
MILIVLFSVLFASCAPASKELVVYTYDSFVADYGAAPKLGALFEKATGTKVTWRSKGDGGQLLADLSLEVGHPGADVVIGIDELLMPRALGMDLFAPYSPAGLSAIPAELRIDPTNRLLPFDHGWFAIIYDSQRTGVLPKSLDDFSDPRYAKQLIVMDPRTSAPGLGLVAWARAAWGPGWLGHWKRLAPAILAMPPGWDAGYGLFLSGEAPFVLSYSTSPAYHRETEGGDRYRVLPLSDGGMREIELAGIVKGAKNRRNAERFMDFLLSKEAQEVLPLTQWMYPVLPSAALPASFSAAVAPERSLAPELAGLSADALAAVDAVAGR